MTARAACPACSRDVRTAASCDERPGAIVYGGEPHAAQIGLPGRCPECGVNVGGFHHQGCDWELCPRCGTQLISCQHGPSPFI